MASQRDYGRYLDEIDRLWGKLMVAGVQPKHVLALRDKKSETPAGANYLIRTLSAAISWGIPRGYRDDNPCKHVRMLKTGEGYSPWTWEQIAHFRENVSKPELWHAAALALYSGQRQADCLAMVWTDIAGGSVSVVQQKTGKKVRVPDASRFAECACRYTETGCDNFEQHARPILDNGRLQIVVGKRA